MSAPLTEDALRALVRDAIGRMESRSDPQPIQLSSHPSVYQYALPPSDGPCFIEPAVRCNHCGYCQVHGH